MGTLTAARSESTRQPRCPPVPSGRARPQIDPRSLLELRGESDDPSCRPAFFHHRAVPLLSALDHLTTRATERRHLQSGPVNHEPQIPTELHDLHFVDAGHDVIVVVPHHLPLVRQALGLAVQSPPVIPRATRAQAADSQRGFGLPRRSPRRHNQCKSGPSARIRRQANRSSEEVISRRVFDSPRYAPVVGPANGRRRTCSAEHLRAETADSKYVSTVNRPGRALQPDAHPHSRTECNWYISRGKKIGQTETNETVLRVSGTEICPA